MDEILAAVLRGAFEIVFELLIRGPGYLFLRLVGRTDADPDGLLALFTGIACWGVIGLLVWVAIGR